MQIFISTFQVKVDDKGRISFPASFRSIIAGKGGNAVYAYCSFVNEGCVEVCTQDRMKLFCDYIENMDVFSQERECLSTVIFGGSEYIQMDSKGRGVISSNLLEEAGIKSEAIIVGKGETFEIWNPEKFAQHKLAVNKTAGQKKMVLKPLVALQGEGKNE